MSHEMVKHLNPKKYVKMFNSYIKILDKRFFGSSPAAFAATEDATPTSNTEGKPLKGSGVTHAVSDIRGKSTDFFINRNSSLTLPLTAGAQ